MFKNQSLEFKKEDLPVINVTVLGTVSKCLQLWKIPTGQNARKLNEFNV